MKKLMKLLFVIFISISLNGCLGESTPTDNDDVSVVKLTDLRSGYLVKGIVSYKLVEARFDLGFCNDELTIQLSGDLIDDHSKVTTYEIAGEDTIVSSNGDVALDAGTAGTLEEGMTYHIEYEGESLDWEIGSISVMEECVVETL